MNEIKLGAEYVDKVTGFEGWATKLCMEVTSEPVVTLERFTFGGAFERVEFASSRLKPRETT